VLLEDVAQPLRIAAAAISPNALRRKDSARRIAPENYSDVRPLARSEPAMTEDTARMQRNGTYGGLLGRAATNSNGMRVMRSHG